MPEEITIRLPCWNCGEFKEFDFRPFIGVTAYEYCLSCKAGIEVKFNSNVLSIDTLSYEG